MYVFWYAVSYLHFHDLIKSFESLRWNYFDREIGEWSRKGKRDAKFKVWAWVPFKFTNKVHVSVYVWVCVDTELAVGWIQVDNSGISKDRSHESFLSLSKNMWFGGKDHEC